MRVWIHRSVRSCFALLLLAGPCASRPAIAIDLVDGRVHVNGYLEAQLRTIARDFDASDDWDLTQWYNVLDVEIEADIAPDGWGPFSLVSAFARVEARYDCVWTHACGMFSSADTYGDRAGHCGGGSQSSCWTSIGMSIWATPGRPVVDSMRARRTIS